MNPVPYALAGACYAIPKIASFLCSHPTHYQDRLLGKIDRIREKIASIRDIVVTNIRERNWAFFCETVVDNAWISSFVITQFLFPNAVAPAIIPILISIIAISCLSWAARSGIGYCIYKFSPTTAKFITPPSIFRRCSENTSRRCSENTSNPSLHNNTTLTPEEQKQKQKQEEEDPILSKYTCPITAVPIHIPVKDGTNGKTIYERSAIRDWLSRRNTSPFTGKPMTVDNLTECPSLQALLKARRKLLSEQMGQ